VNHVGLRRLRKGLLGDLSALVKIAKELQGALQTEGPTSTVYELLDELVLKAFKVVIRAVRFLDIWSQDVVPENEPESVEYTEPNNRPLTPPADSLDQTERTSESQPLNQTENHGDDTILPQEDAVSPTNPGPSEPVVETVSRATPGNAFAAQLLSQPAISAPSVQAPTAGSSLVPRPLSMQAKRVSVSHRLSYVGNSGGAARHNLASERLSTAHDSFLGLLATFIGSHLQSRSGQELTATTQQSVTACRQLLAVVEEVWARDGRRSDPLALARDVMYAKLAELVQATKDIFSQTNGGEDVVNMEQKSHLVTTTTNCIRAAGDCVSKARSVIERIGDFEFEHVGLGLADDIFDSLAQEAAEATVGADVTKPEDVEHPSASYEKPLPIPPQPTTRPPPPPLVLPQTKPLPEPPLTSPEALDSPQDHAMRTMLVESPTTVSARSSRSSVAPLLQLPVPHLAQPEASPTTSVQSPEIPSSNRFYGRTTRTDSVNTSAAETTSTWRNSVPTENASTVSLASTRATTPDRSPTGPADRTSIGPQDHPPAHMLGSFGSVAELQSLASDESALETALEEQVLEKTYALELVYNKEGQITGGSLPALVEKLTTHDTTPDAVFTTTFYLTFRLFCSPSDFAQCLVDRFAYVGSSQTAIPVRLRVYNVFKGWLESHWQNETDSPALSIIGDFGEGLLAETIPAAAKRLLDLCAKVSDIGAGALVPRLVSSLGKTTTSVTVFSDTMIPQTNVTKSQLSSLRASKNGGPPCSILDFDPMELARQFTIIESRIFCSIGPEELLALEWTKKGECRAVNVRAMSTLSNDLANLVADTILQLEEPKKRAVVIKQWVKISMKCLELNNYDSLMAIICSLNSSMVLRLKKTWELVSQKTKLRLEELKSITDVGKNYAVLRQRLQNHVAPCIPFVGIYLTDLTFVDVGNQTTRQLPGSEATGDGEARSVINFDKHMKTAKIIGQLQRFQVPYRLAAVPEMQDWMEAQIQRVRHSEQANIQTFYRRSLLLEPREQGPQQAQKQSPSEGNHAVKESVGGMSAKEKFDLWGSLHLGSSSTNSKEKLPS
jgi:hypothetical protein